MSRCRERAPCRAPGIPMPITIDASWRPCSPGRGSASVRPTMWPSPVRTWRPTRDARRCSSCATARGCCAPSSTCAATAGHRSRSDVGTRRRSPARTTPGSTGSTARWRGRQGSANRRVSIPTTTDCSPSRSRRSPARSSSTSTRTRRRSTPVRSVPRSIRTGSTSSSSVSGPRTTARSTGRSCSRTTARTTTRRSCIRSCRTPATNTRSRPRVRWCSRGIARSRRVTRPNGRCTTASRATPAGRRSPTSPRPSPSTTVATSRCSPTPRSRASPASRQRSD